MDTEKFLEQLKDLMAAAYENDPTIRKAVAAMVPTYNPIDLGVVTKDATYETLLRQTEAVR
jgi:hypothetical protein